MTHLCIFLITAFVSLLILGFSINLYSILAVDWIFVRIFFCSVWVKPLFVVFFVFIIIWL